MDRLLRLFLDQTLNGLVIGNIYALIAVGLAIIFGVGNLINFAHGSVYMVGAYVGWWCVTRLNLPLPVAFAVVVVICGAVGIAIERFGLRRLQGAARIAPLLATIGISFMIDQAIQILFTPNPQSFPNPFSQWRIMLGDNRIGGIDLIIAVVGISSAGLLYLFLRFSKLGWALRATAQDRDAALQMGVDVDQINQFAFALAAVLAGIAGVLVGMYFQTVYPTMSFQAGIKGFAANLLGGLGNIPGAVLGALVLGLLESYGVALFGSGYRNLFAFLILIGVLVLRPNGLFGGRRGLPPEPLTSTFNTTRRPLRVPPWAVAAALGLAIIFPVLFNNPYWLQVLTNAWLIGMIALSVTLVTGTAGQPALGQAGFVAIGAYTSSLLSLRLGWPFELTLVAAGCVSAIIGTLLVLPAFRLRAYYVAIVTIGIGEIVALVILNWDAVTRGPLGLTNIPPPALLGYEVVSPAGIYWYALALLVVLAALQWRLVRSGLGRVWRALRDDEIAAQAFGINLYRYKALAFGASAFIAGISGAFTAHMYSYINNETFGSTTSILALTIAILGGLGNIAGAIVGALVLSILPELLRGLVDYRYLLYGLALVLLVRFRPQGLFGTP
jgi:branched-chain amino acid transport system permease protein